MTIKYNWQDLQKRMYNGQEVQKVMYGSTQIRPSSTPPVPTNDYLRLTALYWDGRAELLKYGNPTNVEIQVSWDGIDWIDYTFWDFIFITEWYTLHWRNKSESVTWFSTAQHDYYRLDCWWFGSEDTRIKVEWDINYMLCKNSVANLIPNLHEYAFYAFLGWNGVISAPKLPSNYAPDYCYAYMFMDCQYLQTLPSLPATTIGYYSYESMFNGCSNIKLSETQTWEYQTEYRIPTTWTGSMADFDSMGHMFSWTWWTYTWSQYSPYAPNINTTYYTSNQVI